jgi:hypothetical protein
MGRILWINHPEFSSSGYIYIHISLLAFLPLILIKKKENDNRFANLEDGQIDVNWHY